MDFLATFFSSLFSVLASNIALLITIALSAFILYMIITSKPFRLIIKGCRDAIVNKLAEIPFIAKGIYASKIRKLKKTLEETRNAQKSILGELNSCLEKLQANKEAYDEKVKKIKHLKKLGNEADAMQLAKDAIDLQKDSANLENNLIPSLQAASEAASKKIVNILDAIKYVEKSRDESLYTMKVANLIEYTNDVLIGDQTSEKDQLLEVFQKKAISEKHRAIGSEMIYADTPEQRMKRIDSCIAESEAKDFLNSL